MGADLKGFVEYKFNDTWHVFASDVDIWRNYRLFSCLCGFRFNEYKHIDARGLPEDASHQVRRQYVNDQSGCASWLTLSELNQAHAEYIRHGHDAVLSMWVLSVMMEELNKVCRCRFVFWLNI